MERPKKLSNEYKELLLESLARDVIKKEFIEKSMSEIIDDLRDLKPTLSGFELALELHSKKNWEDIPLELVIWLDDLNIYYENQFKLEVKDFVKKTKLTPTFDVGDKLIVIDQLSRYKHYAIGTILTVDYINREQGSYRIYHNNKIWDIIFFEDLIKFTQKI